MACVTSILTTSGLETRLWLFVNSAFFLQILSTFMGAGFAFFFGLQLYKKQKKQENQGTLTFFISALTALLNNLYGFKEQIVQHRYQESVECKKILEESPQPKLDLHHMSKYIYGGHSEWPIAQEKLEFLATPNPTVIVLVGVLSASIKTLNTIVIDLNEDTNRRNRREKQLDGNDIKMMLDKNKLLFEQLDSAVFLTNLLADVLIEFGRVKYGKHMKIKTIELRDEKYKAIKPKPIESWEGIDWFPKKKEWWRFQWVRGQ